MSQNVPRAEPVRVTLNAGTVPCLPGARCSVNAPHRRGQRHWLPADWMVARPAGGCSRPDDPGSGTPLRKADCLVWSCWFWKGKRRRTSKRGSPTVSRSFMLLGTETTPLPPWPPRATSRLCLSRLTANSPNGRGAAARRSSALPGCSTGCPLENDRRAASSLGRMPETPVQPRFSMERPAPRRPASTWIIRVVRRMEPTYGRRSRPCPVLRIAGWFT
jgi:hypothetical protein